MREVQGLIFDPTSGIAYTRNEESGELVSTGFTFENVISPQWLPPFWRYLAFQDYATPQTAESVLKWAREKVFQPGTIARVIETPPSGWFRPSHPERLIFVSTTDRSERFNAGRLASSIARNGSAAAARSFAAELKQAGL